MLYRTHSASLILMGFFLITATQAQECEPYTAPPPPGYAPLSTLDAGRTFRLEPDPRDGRRILQDFCWFRGGSLIVANNNPANCNHQDDSYTYCHAYATKRGEDAQVYIRMNLLPRFNPGGGGSQLVDVPENYLCSSSDQDLKIFNTDDPVSEYFQINLRKHQPFWLDIKNRGKNGLRRIRLPLLDHEWIYYTSDVEFTTADCAGDLPSKLPSTLVTAPEKSWLCAKITLPAGEKPKLTPGDVIINNGSCVWLDRHKGGLGNDQRRIRFKKLGPSFTLPVKSDSVLLYKPGACETPNAAMECQKQYP
jgi:hypothetical protein